MPARLFRSLRDSEDGQAVVELALVLPVLLLILLGIFDFGQALNSQNTANHLANLGARLAAVGTFPNKGENLCEYIDSKAAPSNLQNKLGVVITEQSETVGSQVTVRVTDNYHWLTFLQPAIGTPSSPVAGDATMRLEATTNGTMACSTPAAP
jgi:Flp pilus assembly protein TadG